MNKIVFGASKPNHFKIGAKLIMWWEETPASHCYTVLPLPSGKKVVFHSVGAGTSFMSYERFLKINTPIYEKETDIGTFELNSLVDKMIDKLGIKYSKLHLVGLFYKRAIQYVFKKIVQNPFKDQDRSEICVEALCFAIDATQIRSTAEDPEDMGMFEALKMLKDIKGKELIS